MTMRRRAYIEPVKTLERGDYEPLIELALKEDCVSGDCTTLAIFEEETMGAALLRARHPGVLCGVSVARAVFNKVEGSLEIKENFQDGERLQAGDTVLEISGPVRGILCAERVALNFISLLSGIATATSNICRQLEPLNIGLLDTRKTLPGYRRLSKYAVYIGGGCNHRRDLAEMGMIKDNHIAAAGGIKEALGLFRKKYSDKPLEIEVDSIEQLKELLEIIETGETPPPRFLLLDNMDPQTLKEAASMIRMFNKNRVEPLLCEASGGYTLENLSQLEDSGVDYVSMGAVTNRIEPLDFGLDYK